MLLLWCLIITWFLSMSCCAFVIGVFRGHTYLFMYFTKIFKLWHVLILKNQSVMTVVFLLLKLNITMYWLADWYESSVGHCFTEQCFNFPVYEEGLNRLESGAQKNQMVASARMSIRGLITRVEVSSSAPKSFITIVSGSYRNFWGFSNNRDMHWVSRVGSYRNFQFLNFWTAWFDKISHFNFWRFPVISYLRLISDNKICWVFQ